VQRALRTGSKVLVGVAAAVVVLAVIVGGYLGGWWLNTDINNRQAHLNRTTFEQQTTYRDEMVRRIQDVKAIDLQIGQSPDQAPQLQAQRRAIVDIVCRDNTHINGGLDSSTAAFVERECS
jgi:hypothetical protein